MKEKIEEAIELLMCAEINCDNGVRLGPVMFQAVKMQIGEALKLLREENDDAISLH